MLASRWGIIEEIVRAHDGLTEATVDLDGVRAPAVSYDAITGPLSAGDRVLVNTTAVELGLGSGGVHFVVAVEGRANTAPAGGHAMKLRYSPVQLSVDAVEDAHAAAVDEAALDGTPVVILPLHSLLAPVIVAARAARPSLRTAYVMTDAGALGLPVSGLVASLRRAGLLDATVTAGQAFGGDLEAVNVYSGIAAARAVAGAGLIVAGMGPGNLGTASRLGYAAIEAGTLVNAVVALGGHPVVVPRLSFADGRERHRGLSHHTVTALEVAALARAEIVLPPMSREQAAVVEERLAPLRVRHDVTVLADLGDAERALGASGIPLRSMGRSYDDDPVFFLAGAAAGVRAAALAP